LDEELKKLGKAFDEFLDNLGLYKFMDWFNQRLQFKDEGRNKVSFKWWRRWKIAKWHWRRWLEYEGMPKEIRSTELLLFWEKNVLEGRRR